MDSVGKYILLNSVYAVVYVIAPIILLCIAISRYLRNRMHIAIDSNEKIEIVMERTMFSLYYPFLPFSALALGLVFGMLGLFTQPNTKTIDGALFCAVLFFALIAFLSLHHCATLISCHMFVTSKYLHYIEHFMIWQIHKVPITELKNFDIHTSCFIGGTPTLRIIKLDGNLITYPGLKNGQEIYRVLAALLAENKSKSKALEKPPTPLEKKTRWSAWWRVKS